jgi:hypothetical protein
MDEDTPKPRRERGWQVAQDLSGAIGNRQSGAVRLSETLADSPLGDWFYKTFFKPKRRRFPPAALD